MLAHLPKPGANYGGTISKVPYLPACLSDIAGGCIGAVPALTTLKLKVAALG